MDLVHAGARYTTLLASDVQRDGMGLELHWHAEGQDVAVAEVFRSDADHSWTLNTFDCDVPVALIELLLQEARQRLAPKAS